MKDGRVTRSLTDGIEGVVLRRTSVQHSRLDSSAFERLYEEHADGLLLWFARRVLDAEVAVDLMAETFAQAFVSRGRFRGEKEDDAARWLYGIAHHQLSRYQRKGYAERRALGKLGFASLDRSSPSIVTELTCQGRRLTVIAAPGPAMTFEPFLAFAAYRPV